MKSASQILVCAFACLTWLVVSLCAIPAGFLIFTRYIYAPSFAFPPQFIGKEHLPDDCEVTTYEIADLVVDQSTTREKAKEIATTHGAAVVRNILTKEAAQEFRDYVMKANKELTKTNQVYVHENEHRFNLLPGKEEPSVREALKQVGEHPQLRPLIDDMMGPSATLINISVLTVENGAVDQNLHSDTSTSVGTLPDLFVPEYSLVLALQDTTEDMGATQICPGTHRCRGVEGEDDENDLNEMCSRATLSQGDGFIYISDLHHRGTAHIDPKAEARALVFLIFAGTRQSKDDKRSLPFGQVRALKWDLWGHTIDEFGEMHKWNLWHSFGLFQNRKDGLRPWNMIDEMSTIFQTDEETIHMISNDFDFEEFLAVYDMAFKVMSVVLCVYWVCAPILFLVAYAVICIVRSCCACKRNSQYSYDVRTHTKLKMT